MSYEKIVYKAQDWFEVDSDGLPEGAEKLDESKQLADNYHASSFGGPQYKVEGGCGRYVCDLDVQTYTCGKWQIFGLPCAHAAIAIRCNNEPAKNYVHKCYLRGT